MGRRGSIHLVTVMGIRIGVDTSWFIVLFLWIWLLSSDYKHVLPPGHANKAFALATASALLFFASVLVHELGHAVVARRNGVEVSGITLWMFGGMAQLKGEMPSPGAEFRIAAAGPLVTLGIAIGAFLLGLLTSSWTEIQHAADLKRGTNVGAMPLVLSWLVNAHLFVLIV